MTANSCGSFSSFLVVLNIYKSLFIIVHNIRHVQLKTYGDIIFIQKIHSHSYKQKYQNQQWYDPSPVAF